jgi:BCD family chlorophyll transporter-like MFS transporter
MGVWGAAQAFAFGLGGFLGTAAIDLTRFLFADPATAYAIVFAAEALVFLFAARLALTVGAARPSIGPARLDADRLPPSAVLDPAMGSLR